MGAKTVRPNQESLVVDIEGGAISERDVKAAREVVEDVMAERDFQRLANHIADQARDEDTSLTRGTRDRDRATPRDVSHPASDRLRGDLPPPEEFRHPLSARQRKLRCAAKNRVLAAAPASQHRALDSMLGDEDCDEWQRINATLHRNAGDVQRLADNDRAKVQRLDRVVQSYERVNDRTHRVYVAVQVPDTYRDIRKPSDLPDSWRPGARVAFDQFTLTRHNLHETTGHDSSRHMVFEVVTGRGMYLGRSDGVEDTAHILPRGMRFEVVSAEYVTYATAPGHNGRVVVQLREQ